MHYLLLTEITVEARGRGELFNNASTLKRSCWRAKWEMRG